MEPSFGTVEPQGKEGVARIDATPQARINAEEAPTLQVTIKVVEVLVQQTIKLALVVMQPPLVEHMEVTTGPTEVEMT